TARPSSAGTSAWGARRRKCRCPTTSRPPPADGRPPANGGPDPAGARRRRPLRRAPEAGRGARPPARRLALAVARGRGGHERAEQPSGGAGDLLDRPPERGGVRRRRLLHPAELADVLDGGGVDLLGRRGRLEVVERPDVPAHAPSVRGARRYRAALVCGDPLVR